MNEIFKSLNAAQREAVLQEPDVPLFVIAGPGSGKTATICARALHLIEERGIAPERILVITFTKAAAIAMQQRFHRLSDRIYPVYFGTFHACFYHILQESGRFSHRRLLQENQKRNLLIPILKRNPADYQAEDVSHMLSAISYFKNTADREKAMEQLPEHLQTVFDEVFASYEEQRRKMEALDFDDMVYECRNALAEDEALRKRWQNRFSQILIDEFQDINPMQYQVLKLLAGGGAICFAVGDDDQSIYGFRGSDPACIRQYIDEFGAKQVALRINYRSTQSIIDAAASVIKENPHRIRKPVQQAYGEGGIWQEPEKRGAQKETEVKLSAFVGREEQYQYLEESLRTCEEECAVLFRTNVYMQSFALRLARKGIPYVMREHGADIYEHFVVQDIMAYLHLAQGDTERRWWLRILNKPFRNLDRELLDTEEISPDTMRQKSEKLRSKEALDQAEALQKLVRGIENLSTMKLSLGVRYICKALGYSQYLQKLAGDEEGRYEEWDWICSWLMEDMGDHVRLKEWEKMRIRGEKDAAAQPAGKKNGETHKPVQLMTVHGAKGLEFAHVWIPDCNEKVYPHGTMPDEKSCEEERRLFYVAMTRARKSLELLYLVGSEERPRLPSRFLNSLIPLQTHQTHNCPDIHQRHPQPSHTPHRPR